MPDFLPDWSKQVSGILVPCKRAPEFQWYRTGPVVTLGELFLALGQRFAASAIFAFYQVLRPVLRLPNVMPLCPLAVPQTIRDVLIEEYLEARNWDNQTLQFAGKEAIFKEAMRLVQYVVLSDTRPPWRCDSSPMSVPREGAFVKFTKPSFLWWGADETLALFGQAVHHKLASVAENKSLVFAGIVARPLYACGGVAQLKPFTRCMNAASMSPYFQLLPGRASEHCLYCQKKVRIVESDTDSDPEPVSPLPHVLWAYPLVQALNGSVIALSVPQPTRLIVHAPSSEWTWPGLLRSGAAVLDQAKPAVQGSLYEYYVYGPDDSACIWQASASFRIPEL